MAKVLSAKDEKKREMILNGNILQVILTLGAPLALFNGLNLFFKLYDTLMASTISPMSVSVVAYLSQLNLMITALGGGFAVGCSIKISEAYGAGDYTLVHKRVQLLFGFAGTLSAIVLLMIPFTGQFLRLTGTPEEFIESGTIYFALHLLDNVLVLFNTAYIAIERSRGNASRILSLNMVSMVVKLMLNSFFVLVLNQGIEMMAVATIASNSVIFMGFLYHICFRNQGDVFCFRPKEVRYEEEAALPMLKTSIPVVGEKVAFQLGKVTINGMCNLYGSLMVGALGVSNNISSMTMAPINGFQEAGIAVISQNRGAKNEKRAMTAFYTLISLNILAGIFGVAVSMHFLPLISSWFDSGDAVFNELICRTYRYEAMALIGLAMNSSVMALLYGYGFTKLTLLINFSRVFVFRVPVLWFLQNFTNLGVDSIGVVMMISNGSTAVLALTVAFYVLRKIKRGVKTAGTEATDSEEKATDSEEKTTDSEEKATDSEEKATDSEEKATDSEEKATDSEEKTTDSEEKAADSEEKTLHK